MTTKIFLIRHAEAEGNLFRVAHGQYNSTITPRGYQQLHYLRKRFENEHLDAVCGSDLLRAHTTASALYVPRGLAFRPLPLLREIRLGVWEQQSWGEILRLDADMYANFNKRPDLWHAEGAESFAAVRDRMLSAIRRIAAENPGGTVAATSHGAALRTLLGALQGMSLEEIGKTGHADNTAVSLLHVEGDDIRVIYRDDNSHLPPAVSTFRRQSWYKDDAATEPGLWFRTLRKEQGVRELEAMLGEDAAGHVSMEAEENALRIARFQILPHLRGRRYGVQLLGQAVQYARSLGMDIVRISCPGQLRPYFLKYGFRSTAEGSPNDIDLDYRLVIRDIP